LLAVLHGGGDTKIMVTINNLRKGGCGQQPRGRKNDDAFSRVLNIRGSASAVASSGIWGVCIALLLLLPAFGTVGLSKTYRLHIVEKAN
jgi:hypothetical protein